MNLEFISALHHFLYKLQYFVAFLLFISERISNTSASSTKVHTVATATGTTPPTSPESAHSTQSAIADARVLSLPKTTANKLTPGPGRVPLAGHSSSSVNLRSATLGSNGTKRSSPSGASALGPVAQLIVSLNPVASLVRGSSDQQQQQQQEEAKRHSGTGGDSTSLHSLGDLETLDARAKKLSHTSLMALGERDAEHTAIEREEFDQLVTQFQQHREFVKDFLTQFDQIKVLP